MASECFVVDEWIIHDLRGDNSPSAQEEAGEFLVELRRKCDHIAVLRGSPWEEKAYGLYNLTDVVVRRLSQYLWLNVLQDSRKCRYVERNEVRDVPEHVREVVRDDDLYLVQTYEAADSQALVTSDGPLCVILGEIEPRIRMRLRDEFLREYL